jgi:ribonuclease HI
MNAQQPHYLLFSQIRQPTHESREGVWRFVLEAADGGTRFEVSDREPNVTGDRLALLAVIRGLEALDQPSVVSLRTTSRYVARGFRFGLPAWRENNWCWESFGAMRRVDNDDLWRKIDQALRYHRVGCRRWRPVDSSPKSPSESWHSPKGIVATPTHRLPTDRLQGMVDWAGIFQPRRRPVAFA